VNIQRAGIERAQKELANTVSSLNSARARTEKARVTLVNAKRNEIHQMEGNLARSQVEFDEAVKSFRSLLDQYGLTMDVPMPEPRPYR